MHSTVEWIAHRGASHDAPENTLSAVRLAWQQNADAVEVDCRLTADDQIVGIHDEDTLRTAGWRVRVAEATLDELRQLDVGCFHSPNFSGVRVPTLSEVVATIPPGRRLLVEVKCGVEIVSPLVQLLGAMNHRTEAVSVISYDLDVLRAVKQRCGATICYLIARFEPDRQPAGCAPPTIAELITRANDAYLDGLDLHVAGPLDELSIAEIRAAGLALYVWATDDPAEARRMIDLGVDGIATNRPAWLRERCMIDT